MTALWLQDGVLYKQTESMMNYLLVSIMVLAFMVLFINQKTVKIRVFSATAIIILMFDVNLFLLNHLLEKHIGFIPFKALFGPLFLFHIKMFNGVKVSIKTVFIHFLPFFILLTFFFFLLTVTEIAESMFYYYLIILLEGISMFLYGLYALLPWHTKHSIKLRNIIFICCISFILDASFTIMNSLSILNSREFDPHHLHFVNDAVYFVTALLGWVYFFSAISMMINPVDILYPSRQYSGGGHPAIEQGPDEDKSHELVTGGSYRKGRLSDETLTTYQKNLNNLMQNEKAFLQNELTLTQLAKLLKISNHHLTQVLNIRENLGFYQYINGLRVLHATDLINEGMVETNVELLAVTCGFNNKTSFNRYFKALIGETPSEYIRKSQSAKV
ncbi:AraC family transcriptional regulator [Pedobacter sp. V48]|uniref:helix-turn-helix domain-containing protein n=1 Tax=Pedobacter sp. V48 TaxID=509635 RepID=UPI0003E4E610|nr:helix-turn-helix domain-containing protein [Pedobacter sp. V48]ETZ20861.1 hypothetical protein N824_29680 [Pedobacter sp. V48]